jgi:hypothetical protein
MGVDFDIAALTPTTQQQQSTSSNQQAGTTKTSNQPINIKKTATTTMPLQDQGVGEATTKT